ncbi:protein trachealess-like [Pomacea canaliculata]|uniref:protein trachealess-like n=1 Tax=Pomacea canaliculata TaxID=400727 RepID=UPI000D725A68|nr:protein trachealess-like [Pomacea canaliculata]
MMMNEQQYFHWDLLRQPIQAPTFGMGAPFFDVNSILELRKEKSRDAARSRRGKENYEFYELAKLLPLPAAITSQLDKASIIRLSISYLKLRDFSGHGDPPWNRDPGHHVKTVKGPPRRRGNSSVALDLFESHHGTHILQSLDGFAFILGNDGRFLYISETVSIYLGLSQVEMAGSSIFDYVHQQDHPELAEHLGCVCLRGRQAVCLLRVLQTKGRPPGHDLRGYVMNPNPKKGCDRSFCLRMKSTLTKRGVHVKSSGYRVVHVLGQLRPQMTMGLGRKCGAPVLGLVGVAIALPPPTVTELRLEHDTFITRMAPDFTVTFCESLVSDFMDLSAEDMTNRSLYDMCHAGDIANLRQAHVNVLTKGQAMTDYYRLLNRQGGYVWIQTCATTLLNGKNADDQNILSINYVLSGVEKGNSVMNMWQMCGEVSPAQPRASSPATASQSSGKDRGSSTDKDEKTKGSNHQNKDSNKGTQSNQKIFSTRSPSHVGLGSVGGGDSGDGDTDGLSDSDVVETGTDSGGQYAEKNGSTQDSKNSRRKMERPRKRKREELDAGLEKGSGRGVPGSLP